MIERRAEPRAGPLARWYYALKYRPFRKERRPYDGRRGLIMLQVDALAWSDLQLAISRGYCPTMERLLREGGFTLTRWFCGLPSATPYCQAGIFHGENDGIPAFRFYDKPGRRIISCNAAEGVQYIRDRIRSPGALAGGSSYVNLLDGDASSVAFTIASRERTSLYNKLGGTRMALLIALHPIRLARMVFESFGEYLREEWERLRGELAGRVPHSEGVFPFIRILSNVVIRELQTMAILLDVYLGSPVIYSTFMQYDELGHHFGPSSRSALGDLARTDARIAEIWRMARLAAGRRYDLVVLSDHGMTPALSYRVKFRESLGTSVERILESEVLSSHSDAGEFAEVAPGELELAAAAMPPRHSRTRRALRRVGAWLRSRYGLLELVIPEKYRIAANHQVVVTYSSCLAHLYFADEERQLSLEDIRADARRDRLYAGLLAHPGIGLIVTRSASGVVVQSSSGRAVLREGGVHDVEGENPARLYGSEPHEIRAIESLLRQPNSGDCVLFGAYDGTEIVSFDDQVGAHGSAGGDQMYPFIIAPEWLELETTTLEDARDIHRAVMLRYAEKPSSGAA